MTDEPRIDHGRRVLVVEDERGLRDMLVRAMTGMEFEVTGVATAEAGLEILEGREHDIVLSDLNLPGLSGLELCHAVRERWPLTQLVILTGYGDLDAAQRAIRLDVVDFLTKPCPLGDLEAALDRALRRRLHHIVPRVLGGLDREALEPSPTPDAAPQTLEELEREHILDALARHDGSRAATAEALGISVRTLYYRLKQYEGRGFIVR